MTHQHDSHAPHMPDGGTSDRNGHHPQGVIDPDTPQLHGAVDDPYAEARHDREFARQRTTANARTLAGKMWHGLLEHLCVKGDELHGLASTREVRQRAALTAAFGTGANAINFLLVLPFLSTLCGPVAGTAISVGVYWQSNLSQKIAVRTGDGRRRWASAGLAGFASLSIVLTGLSPWGTTLLLFRSDLNNQLAGQVVSEFVNADVTAERAAAQEKRKRAAARQEECSRHRKDYETLKAAGNEAYHASYRLAFGPYMANEPPNRWQGVPESEIPACPAARLLALDADNDIEAAEAAYDRRLAEVKTTFGDSYVTYLKEEHPGLFDAYFKRVLSGYRIRSGVTELAEAQALVFSGKAAPTLVMVVFTALSAITSYTAIALTRHHAKNPLVRQSWSPLARSRQIKALRDNRRIRREGERDEQ